MFDTITEKTREAKAYIGATIAVTKALRKEYKYVKNVTNVFYPHLTKVERRAIAVQALNYEVVNGMIDI